MISHEDNPPVTVGLFYEESRPWLFLDGVGGRRFGGFLGRFPPLPFLTKEFAYQTAKFLLPNLEVTKPSSSYEPPVVTTQKGREAHVQDRFSNWYFNQV